MSEFTIFFQNNGVPEEAFIWITMLPIVMTVITASRQIVGIKGFGIMPPALIGFAFAATGIQFGLIALFVAMASAVLMRAILKKIRLLYLPKMSLVLSGVTISMMLFAPLLPYRENIQFPQVAFSFIILIVVMELFSSHLIERGMKETFNIAAETTALSVAVFFVISWGWLRDILLIYPVPALGAALVANLLLGKWTGLRLSEYLRFKNLLSK